MTFSFQIPGMKNPLSVQPGSSIIFVGANGSGKTRLAVFIEEYLGEKAHRISAHRALKLNPSVPKIRGVEANNKLRFGHEGENANANYRNGRRWRDATPAVAMLDDFDSLLQVLFADYSVISGETHRKINFPAASRGVFAASLNGSFGTVARNRRKRRRMYPERFKSGTLTEAADTKFETLAAIWQRLLPHRRLDISGDDIRVKVKDAAETYSATDMSDGERAIFYLIGQALVADSSALFIIDEPELHVHPSIMSNLWDEIEAARKDCAFLFITHDLHFASARSAQKYVIQSYTHTPSPSWTIENVPENIGFSEEVTTLILGSRRPILFVEGTETSLDIAIYRCCYPEWTIIPRGSCKDVVHAVSTMSTLRENDQLTHITCAGIIDADDHTDEEIGELNELSVFPLPVSEIENLILLPEVSRAIAELEGFSGAELEQLLSKLKKEILSHPQQGTNIDDVALRYCRRRIDRTLKKIDLSKPKSIADLAAKYQTETSNLNINDIAEKVTRKIQGALQIGNLPGLLASYDNKGLLNFAATHLSRGRLPEFKAWLTRMLCDEARAPDLVAALKTVLPKVQAHR